MAKENHLSYKTTQQGAACIEKLRQKFIELDDLIDEVTNDQEPKPQQAVRARALAKTSLEEARMWAVTSVVHLNNTGPNEYQGSVSGDTSEGEKEAA